MLWFEKSGGSKNRELEISGFHCKYRITLTFVKPRGGEGQNGRLCPLGFLVY